MKELIVDYANAENAIRIVEGLQNGDSQRDEWKKFKNADDFKIYYKKEPDKSLYTFYSEKVINAPVFNLIAVLREVPSYKDWVPMMAKSDIPIELSHFQMLGEIVVKAPWPYYWRSAYISIRAMPAKNDKAVIITMKSIKEDKWLKGKKINKDSTACEVDVNFCTCYLQIIDDNNCNLKFLTNIDPKLTTMP